MDNEEFAFSPSTPFVVELLFFNPLPSTLRCVAAARGEEEEEE